MKRFGKSPHNIRQTTPRDERLARRKGGFNYGIEQVIYEDESDQDWEEFVEEMFTDSEAVEGEDSELGHDAIAPVRSQPNP